jgi:hypothetical protein
MAITVTLSNHYKYQLANKKIDLAADTLKIILMDDSFVFDKDAHADLAALGSPTHELPTGNGYTQQNKALSGGTLTEDDDNDKAVRIFDDITWTASGGSIGPTGAAIIYDDTTVDKTIIGCVDFGTDYTIPDESSLQIQSPTFQVSQVP